MKKYFLTLILSMMWVVPFTYATETDAPPQNTADISEEDMEIIKNIETLELMEMAKHFQLLQEMDILLEGDNNEKTN